MKIYPYQKFILDFAASGKPVIILKPRSRVRLVAEINIDRLGKFIESHPPAQFHGCDGEGIIVSSEYVDMTTKEVTRVRETIPATLAAVRDWLGY